MNKTVLILSYYFPPEGGPAVQRISKFTKFLPNYNFDVVVITSQHRIKIKDKSLLNDIKNISIIYRIIDIGIFLHKKIIRLFLGKNFVDHHQLWNFAVRLFIKQILKKNKIDVLFSTTPPHSSNLLAHEISVQYNIPWVADFRDEWTYDPNFKTQLNREHIKNIEEKILKHAAAIITVTQKGRINFSSTVGNENKVYCIYNGYDEDDYKNVTAQNENNDKLKIIYTGRFTKKSSPEKLFQVLNKMVNSSSFDFSRVEIKIVGQDGNKMWIRNYPSLKKLVKFVSYQPHDASVKLLVEADVLLLLASNTPQSEVFTGKLFEYMYLRKPIFAVIRYRGELSEWLSDYGNAYIGIESETSSVENATKNVIEDFIKNNLKKKVNEEFVQKYNRNVLTKALSEIFNNILTDRKILQ